MASFGTRLVCDANLFYCLLSSWRLAFYSPILFIFSYLISPSQA